MGYGGTILTPCSPHGQLYCIQPLYFARGMGQKFPSGRESEVTAQVSQNFCEEKRLINLPV